MAAKTTASSSGASDLAGLADLDMNDLRRLWTELFGIEPVQRVSRELLTRAIAHRLQENAEGGFSKKTLRKLARFAADLGASGSISVDAAADIRAGTRLVREWQGRVHEVIVLDDQYLWKGARYRSLSEIARLITGTRWSGPRFFGTGAAGKVVRGDRHERKPVAKRPIGPDRRPNVTLPHAPSAGSRKQGAGTVGAGHD
jgi:hypothetical protein